jgi:hypothetical protein
MTASHFDLRSTVTVQHPDFVFHSITVYRCRLTMHDATPNARPTQVNLGFFCHYRPCTCSHSQQQWRTASPFQAKKDE